MTQLEIKNWLEWFVENFNYSFNSKGDLHESDSGEFYALGMPYGYEIYEALQLAIQDEIAKQKYWTLEINLLLSGIATCAIRRIVNGVVKEKFYHEAETILQAMMLAFQEAWEAVK